MRQQNKYAMALPEPLKIKKKKRWIIALTDIRILIQKDKVHARSVV